MNLLCVSLMALLAAAPENLLPNSGFEALDAEGVFPVDWTATQGPAVSLGTGRARSGDRYVHVEDSSPTKGVALESRRLPCRLDRQYTASAWVRLTGTCRPGVYLQFHDDTGRRIAERHVRAPGECPDWTLLEVTMPTPDDAEQVSVLLYAYGQDVGGFDFDDAALTAREVSGGTRMSIPVVSLGDSRKKPPVEIGDRLQLFVDDYLLDARAGAELRLHAPQPREVALTFDAPWEGATSAYVTVVKDGDRYRAWYRGSDLKHEVACYAESADGIVWTKPKLGLFEYNGSKENNIIWTGKGKHNFTPFLDANPKAKPEERFKALAGGPLIALASPDGIHWQPMREEPVITKGAFDSQNLAFWDSVRGRYAAYYRGFREGVRAVMTCTSDDFLNWTEPQWIDLGDSRPEQHYTNATTPYFRAPDVFLSFPKRFVPERKWDPAHKEPGISDGVLLTSRDGIRFDRTFMEAFLRPGNDPENWTDRNMMIAYGVVPTGPGEVSLYYSEHYRHPTARLRRGTLRTDGFVSVHAGYAGGEILTRPMVFAGKELVINFATSAVGSARFEVQDVEGQPIPGFALQDCPHHYGDEIERVVRWEGAPDVAALAGRPVRLRVRLKDADLYSFRFGG